MSASSQQVHDGFASINQVLDLIPEFANTTITATTEATTQPYAPFDFTDYTAIDFFGDSITYGAQLVTPSSERWPALLCAALEKTENNYGVSGSEWPDLTVYAQSTHANPTFFSIGMNDHRLQPPVQFDQMERCALNDVLFCTLPSSCIVNPRSNAVVKTGVWQNSDLTAPYGMDSSTVGSSLSATVTGRYVAIGMIAHATTETSIFTVTIDGANANVCNFRKEIVDTGNGADYVRSVWTYDTRSSTSHNVVYTYTSNTSSGYVFVSWFGGFNQNQVGCNPSFLLDVYTLNATNSPYTPYTITIGNKYVFKMMYKELARVMRTVWGLPVYFIEDSGSYPLLGNMVVPEMGTPYNIHPGPKGHKYVSERIQTFLTSGEFIRGRFT